jgi:hypothetical protein
MQPDGMERFPITDHGEDDKDPLAVINPWGLSNVLHLGSNRAPTLIDRSPSGIELRILCSGNNLRERTVASLRNRGGAVAPLILAAETLPGVPQPEDDVVVVVPPEDTLSVSETLSTAGLNPELAKSMACPACLDALSSARSLELDLIHGGQSLLGPLLVFRGESGLLPWLSDLVLL